MSGGRLGPPSLSCRVRADGRFWLYNYKKRIVNAVKDNRAMRVEIP
jgi:hypothetical protein